MMTKVNGKLLVIGRQLLPDFVLRSLTGAVVPDHAETHGVWLQGKRQLLGRRARQPAARDHGERNQPRRIDLATCAS